MKEVRSKLAWTLATWFGCGAVPKAPGTMGTLGAIPLYLLVARAWGTPGVAVVTLAVTAAGIWAGSVVAHELGRDDPQVVVIDEVAGFFVTMLPMRHVSWGALVAGFLLFRLLDMVKPWPVRRFEELPGGWGIVLDDVAAGLMGAAIMAALHAAEVIA
jgi:phosphatidylglycerophosphatase A